MIAMVSETVWMIQPRKGQVKTKVERLCERRQQLARVREDVFQRLQRLSLRFHQGRNAGDLIHRAAWDTYSFQTLFQQGLMTTTGAALTFVLMVIVMLRLNVQLALVALKRYAEAPASAPATPPTATPGN